MPTDSYTHELRRKTPTSSKHDASKNNRSDSGYSTSSSTSAGSNPGSKAAAAAHKSHARSHHPTHGPSSSSSSSSSGSKRGRARFSVPEDAQGMSRFASLTGFLRKQADNEEGAWNRYYFALRPATYLYYYNTPSDDRPRGIIDLEFLQDIRYNVDCLQRSVGGSEYCFRMTGQMPKGTLKDVADVAKLKLRPMFLDPESSDESRQWMDALKKHRFHVDHAEGFTKMGLRVKETEHTLEQLGEEAQRVASTAESIRWKGRALLNKLRGIESEPEPESRGSFDVDSNQDDIFSTLQELESLVEDFSAEAEQQARVIETLRAREVQQAKAIETLREKETQQEKRIRELIKNGPPGSTSALSSSNGLDSSSNSIISEEELRGMDRMGAAKGRSTSNVQELFKKTTSFLASKKTADGGNAPASSPVTLEVCVEVPEEESEAAPAVAAKKSGGFVDAIKKRVAKNTGATTAITQASTPTSRESDDTVSITTDDRGSVEIASSANDEKLPLGWTKRESRNHPGEYYYAHTSGFTCWDMPNDFLLTEEGEELVEETGNGAGGDEPQQQPVVVNDVELEKSEFYGKQPLGSLAAVAQAVMEAEAAANEPPSAADKEDDKPVKKSKGWGFLKKLKKGSAAAPAQSPKEEPETFIAVEHEDGRHEF